MAISDRGVEQAEYTFVYEKRERRGEPPELVRLPFAWLRFGDVGEERKYVVTLPTLGVNSVQGIGGTDPDWRPYRQFYEIMPNLPFPLDSGGPQPDVPGPLGVHFFGPV